LPTCPLCSSGGRLLLALLLALQPPQLPLLALVLLCSLMKLKQQRKVVAHAGLPAQRVAPVCEALELLKGQADAVSLSCMSSRQGKA
jgi:hypothetical protein